MASKFKMTAVRLPEETRKKVEELAEKEDRSISKTLQRIIEQHFEKGN